MDIFLFSLIFTFSIIAAGMLSSLFIPDLGGIASICFPLICAIPLAFKLFLSPAFVKKVRPFQRYLLPGLIFPVLFALMFGLFIYDQNPQVMFKRLLGDPIPNGVSNIHSINIADFSVHQTLSFQTTPQAVDEIIAKNKLKLMDNPDCYFGAPFEDFPDVKKNQDWLCYTIDDNKPEKWGYLYVNIDKSTVLFRLDFGG